MKVLTFPESLAWIQQAGFVIQNNTPIFLPPFQSCVLQIPASAGKQVFISRIIARDVVPPGVVLLLITESGIWPSRENLNLFTKFREAFKEMRPLEVAPGHLFEMSEREDLISFLLLLLIFGWGGFVLCENTSIALNISHDECIDLYVTESQDLIRIKELWDTRLQ